MSTVETATFNTIREQALAEWGVFTSPERVKILVGTATCGCAAGAEEAMPLIREYVKANGIDCDIDEVGCLGLCYAEPLVEISKPGMPHLLYGNVTAENVGALLDDYFGKGDPHLKLAVASMNGETFEDIAAFDELPMVAPQVRVVLRNCGIIDPDNANHYIACGGYTGLANALAKTQDEVIDEVKKSGLRGRGGAGFPTALKWGFCHKAPGDHKYMVCNADEGDPGAFMDRSVIENDPHSVLEGMVIAAYAIGADQGYIYVRAEYPLAIKRLRTAIDQAKELGMIGENILGSDFSFSVKIKEGAGAFVCGEETALLASIEGRRGMPRSRPPFPANEGLHGKPTNINNVETLANIPVILEKGGEAFAHHGTEKSCGTKTFALAGKIVRTGLIEVPLGTSLRDIVYEVGGGIPDDKAFKAVQTGGPSGGCIPGDLLDTPVDYENLARVGAIMGSGGMVVMDEETCMVDVARYFIDFTRKESCGKCVPCRLGTKQMLQILEGITVGKGKPEDVELLKEIGEAVKLGSLCGLGQTAPNPVLTTIRYYQDEYDAHVKDGRCPAGQCSELVRYTIDAEKCNGCRLCAIKCPVDAIEGEKKKPHILDEEKCIRCGICFDKCKFDAVIRS